MIIKLIVLFQPLFIVVILTFKCGQEIYISIDRLKLDMLDHIIDLWRYQNITLQFIRDLYERNIDD